MQRGFSSSNKKQYWVPKWITLEEKKIYPNLFLKIKNSRKFFFAINLDINSKYEFYHFKLVQVHSVSTIEVIPSVAYDYFYRNDRFII